MKRVMTGVVAAALLVPSLAACGGGDDSDFCEYGSDLDIASADSAEVKEELQKAADAAPDEIKDDIQLVVDSLDAMESGDMENLDQDGLMEASTNITNWVSENCSE